MEIKTKALCLRASDYGEKDKILVLLTAEYGKIVARIRSVRTPKSKLKICASTLCLGEYILNKSGGRYVVIGANAENNFFESWSDIHKNCAALIIAEALDRLTENEVAAAEELALAVRALYAVNYNDALPYVYAVAFLAKLAPICGIDIGDYALVNHEMYSVLSALSGADFDEVETLELTVTDISRVLSYVAGIYKARTGESFSSLKQALKLIAEL